MQNHLAAADVRLDTFRATGVHQRQGAPLQGLGRFLCVLGSALRVTGIHFRGRGLGQLLIRMETQAGEEVGISVGNAVPIYILQPETLPSIGNLSTLRRVTDVPQNLCSNHLQEGTTD